MNDDQVQLPDPVVQGHTNIHESLGEWIQRWLPSDRVFPTEAALRLIGEITGVPAFDDAAKGSVE